MECKPLEGGYKGCATHHHFGTDCPKCEETVAAPQAPASPSVRSINWLDAAVARKNDWEERRISALRLGNIERAEYWEGRRDGINDVLMLHNLAASSVLMSG